ncbi:response regulator [Paracoccus sp. N5]|uniref:response regulator n=1 Tax=Paracoccus sp. N5 TaxID=1101189 RepID=UPI0003643826|nr:response regulator [Paracoccus sp. N5]
MTLTVLLLHDDSALCAQAYAALTEAGLEVIPAVDGTQALERLGQREIDAIVTGVNMAGLDGFAFIEAVRQQPALYGMPILVLSAEAMPDLKTRARNAGAAGWLPHPFDPQRLVETVLAVTG